MSITANLRGDGRCEVRSCEQYDFLPVRCDKCSGTFCGDHKDYARHSCRGHVDRQLPTCPVCAQQVLLKGGADADTAVMAHIDAGCPKEASVTPTAERLNFCSHRGCTKNEHVNILCRGCGNQYCIDHRSEDVHACVSLRSTPSPPPQQSQPRPAQPTPAPKRAKPTSPPLQPAASSAPVSSPPPPSSSPPPAPHLTLGYPDVVFQSTYDKPYVADKGASRANSFMLQVHFTPGRGVRPCYLLVPKAWSVGKVLDAACSKGGVRNANNTGGGGGGGIGGFFGFGRSSGGGGGGGSSGERQRLRVFDLSTFAEVLPNAKVDCALAEGRAILVAELTAVPDELMAEAMQYVWQRDRGPRTVSGGGGGGGGGGGRASTGGGRWSCSACTLENEGSARACAVCGTGR